MCDYFVVVQLGTDKRSPCNNFPPQTSVKCWCSIKWVAVMTLENDVLLLPNRVITQ